MGRLVRVCGTADLPPGEKIAIEVSGESVLVVSYGGQFYAVSNVCTHERVELVTGFLIDDEIVCSAHLSRFKLGTGEVLNPPATTPLKTYRTIVQNGDVYVEV